MSDPSATVLATPRVRRTAALGGHPLVRLIARRLVALVVVVFVVMVGVFAMVQLVPGDPIYQAFGTDITREQYERMTAQYGFDKPLAQQFSTYVGNVLQGDLGRSFPTQQPVVDLIKERMWTSAALAGAALLLLFLIAVPLGMLAGALTQEGRHPRFEVGFMGGSSLLASLPDYLIGTVLVFVFAVQLRIFPVAGADGAESLVLPAIAVCMASTMTLARIVRIETLNVLAQDYIRTARSQRLPTLLIYARHVLPNVLTAALTVGGLIFAQIIGGAVIVENVFARPGLGSALVRAVVSNDYPVVQGITLMVCVMVVLLNMVIDIVLAIIDPRSLAKES